MAASQPLVAAEILDAYKFRRHRVLLDVGGGEGAFLQAVAARVPSLTLQLFDLPAVAERARARLGPLATVTGGDMFADRLPTGADIVTLVRVLHDHDDSHVMTLLRSVRAVLPRGGVLVVAEPMAGTGGAERMGDAYFGMYLLAMGSGRPRSTEILQKMLEDSGFGRVRRHPTRTPLICGVLSCVNLA
jgi:demethylspheroidene O-methyltransferase